MTALHVGLMPGTSMDAIDAAPVHCYSRKPGNQPSETGAREPVIPGTLGAPDM